MIQDKGIAGLSFNFRIVTLKGSVEEHLKAFILTILVFGLSGMARAKSALEKENERARFIAQAFNRMAENEAPIQNLRKNLSAKDQKAFDKILKNKKVFKRMSAWAYGDQIHFYLGDYFLYSVAFDQADARTLIINGWYKKKFDPNNIAESLSDIHPTASLWNLIIESAYAKELSYEFEKNLPTLGPLFLVASGDKMLSVPNLKQEVAGRRQGDTENFFYEKSTTGALWWKETVLVNRGLKISCNSQNRARVEMRKAYTTDVLIFDDQSDKIEVTDPKQNKKIQFTFRREKLSSEKSLEEISECLGGVMFEPRHGLELTTLPAQTMKGILSSLPEDPSAQVNMPDVIKRSGLDKLEADYDSRYSTGNKTLSYRDMESLIYYIRKCDVQVKQKLIYKVQSFADTKDITAEEANAQIANLKGGAKVQRLEASLQRHKTQLSKIETDFQRKHGLSEPLKLDKNGKLLSAPPTKISGQELLDYKKDYGEVFDAVNRYQELIAKEKANPKVPLEHGLAMIRTFGKCCGDNECKAEMAKLGVNITPSENYKEDEKQSAIK